MNEACEAVAGYLAEVTYRPGWSITAIPAHPDGVVVRVEVRLVDSRDSGRLIDVRVDSTPPPWHVGEAEFIRWLAWRLQEVEVHESKEWLRYRGELVDDPHAADQFPFLGELERR